VTVEVHAAVELRVYKQIIFHGAMWVDDCWLFVLCCNYPRSPLSFFLLRVHMEVGCASRVAFCFLKTKHDVPFVLMKTKHWTGMVSFVHPMFQIACSK
jgi:hypothetical protein